MKSGRTFLVLWDVHNINDTNTSCVPILANVKVSNINQFSVQASLAYLFLYVFPRPPVHKLVCIT